MAYVEAYSHITIASIPADIKDQVWLSLESWKGYLQSFPGLMAIHVAARELPNGDIRFHVETRWQYPEQLEEWNASPWAAEKLFMAFPKPAYDVVSDVYSDID